MKRSTLEETLHIKEKHLPKIYSMDDVLDTLESLRIPRESQYGYLQRLIAEGVIENTRGIRIP